MTIGLTSDRIGICLKGENFRVPEMPMTVE
jgi:hypothetical protein